MLIRGQKVSLRRAQPNDAVRAYEWLALSDLTPTMLGAPLYSDLPVPSPAAFESHYPSYLFERGNPYDGRALIISSGAENIGVLIYGAVQLLAGAVELEMWLAEKRFCSSGLGSEALRLACAWLQDELGVDNFALRPSRRNVRALRAFRRAGFRSVTDPAQAQRELGLSPNPLADSELMLLTLLPPTRLQHDPARTYAFFDTEFTDLLQPQLISLGAAATDGNAFYCEISDWPRDKCSDFVVDVVLPLLDGNAVPHGTAAEAFTGWLCQRRPQPVIVVTDSAYDRWALADLLGGESLPDGVLWQRVALPVEQLDAVMGAMGLRRHHALDDARGLRQAILNPDD